VDYDFGVLYGLWVQLMIAAGLLYGRFPPLVVMALSLAILPIVLMQPRPSELTMSRLKEAGGPSQNEVSTFESLGKRLFPQVMVLAAMFAFGAMIWEEIVWLSERFFDGSILGFRPIEVSSDAVGLIVAIVALPLILIWNRFHAPRP
jgi:hypothetical protein